MIPLWLPLLASYLVDGDTKAHHVTPYLYSMVFIYLFELEDISDSRCDGQVREVGGGTAVAARVRLPT